MVERKEWILDELFYLPRSLEIFSKEFNPTSRVQDGRQPVLTQSSPGFRMIAYCLLLDILFRIHSNKSQAVFKIVSVFVSNELYLVFLFFSRQFSIIWTSSRNLILMRLMRIKPVISLVRPLSPAESCRGLKYNQHHSRPAGRSRRDSE